MRCIRPFLWIVLVLPWLSRAQNVLDLGQVEKTSEKPEDALKESSAPLSVTQDTEPNPDDSVDESIREPLESSDAASVDESTTGDESLSDSTEIPQTPLQSGPFIDLLGPQLYSLEMVDDKRAQLSPHYTNDALRHKRVVGLYFSADWCGPCRKFTPELTEFYKKMNSRRGKKDQFEIVWVSRCRDVNSYGQYFAQMGGWLALPPEEALGERGKLLSDKFRVKGIPTLVLLDDLANVITLDGRNKIPADRAGIGFPWRNPVARVVSILLPRSLRLMMKSQVIDLKDKLWQRVRRILKPPRPKLIAS